MTNQLGTIRGVTQLLNTFAGAAISSTVRDSREVWLLTVDFPAYTGSADTAQISGVAAAIQATTRDGKARTLRGALPGPAGADSTNLAAYFTGTAVEAATVSSDNLTGQLSDNTGTELTATTGVSNGVCVIVIVDIT